MFTCNCGCCGGMILHILDGTGFLSFVSGDFGNEQSVFSGWFKSTYRAIRKKSLKDFYLKKQDLIRLRRYLLMVTETDEKIIDNVSKVKILHEEDFGDNYTVLLTPKIDLKDIVRGKVYWCYDITLNKKEASKIVRQINKALNDAESK